MKMNRRKFGTMAGLSASAIFLPWTATSCANENEKSGRRNELRTSPCTR
jgi:hypothetical protein